MGQKHENLVKLTLVELSKHGIMAWPTPTGMAQSLHGERIMIYGLVGSADISSIIPPNGRAAFFEIKIPPDYQKPDQINFMNAVRSRGSHYSIVTPDTELGRIIKELIT